MTQKSMRRREFGALALGTVGAFAFARHAPQAGWTPLWNGKTLDGWTTWMQRPEPTSEVPGLARDANGRYTEPIGSGRDPLKAFTVEPDVDGRPAIRISGEVYGELRTTRSFKDYHLTLQFKWGEKKWPPRAGARCIKEPDNERPSGQWNTVELVCLGQHAIHIVNGKVVMRLYGPTRINEALPTLVTSGAIILQSEGAEVSYREIAIRPITAIPAEYAG